MDAGENITALARDSIAGDPGALAALLTELEPLVVRTARLIVGSGSWAAEDAAQEALVDIVRGIGKVKTPEAVLAWTLRVTTTRALKIARRERLLSLRRAPAFDAELLAETVSESTCERARALKDAFDRLTPRLRATATLRLQLALSEAEVAEILDCSPQTVKSNLHRARTKLMKALRESGFEPSAIPTAERELS